MSWRVATCLQSLLGEVDARWPDRKRNHDGSVGDLAHSKRTSDHNPWVKVKGTGVVRARDFTAAGIDANWLAARVVALGISGDERLRNGGYVIWNGHIWSSQAGWRKRVYSGPNKHTQHVHVSVTQDYPAFDSRASWGVVVPVAVPTPKPSEEDDVDEATCRRIVSEELDRLSAKIDAAVLAITGGKRERDSSGQVIDRDKDNVSIADLLTKQERVGDYLVSKLGPPA